MLNFITTMSYKNLLCLGAITIASLLASCTKPSEPVAQVPTPQDYAKQYMEAVKKGDTAQAESLYCVSSDQAYAPFTSAIDYQLGDVATITDNGVPIQQFSVDVTGRVIGVNQQERTDRFAVWVWTPADGIQFQKVQMEKLSALGVRPPALHEENWSTAPYCVFVPGDKYQETFRQS